MDTDETQPLEQPSFVEACKGPVDPTSKQLLFEEVNVDDPTVGGIKKGDSQEAPGSTEEVDPKSIQKSSDPGDFSGLASKGEKYKPPELPLKPACMVKNCTDPISPEQQLHSVKVCDQTEEPEDEEDQKIKRAEEKKRQKKAKAKAKAKGRPAKSKAAAKPKAATMTKKGGNESDGSDSDGQEEGKKTQKKKKEQKKKKPETPEEPPKKKTREDGGDSVVTSSKKKSRSKGTKRPLTEGVDAETKTTQKPKTKTETKQKNRNQKKKKVESETEAKAESEAEKIAREKKAKLSRKSAAYHRAKREAKLAGDDDSTILEKAKAVSW